ncbi:hypothetical protein ACFE04_031061 [Oxalis oulophora]
MSSQLSLITTTPSSSTLSTSPFSPFAVRHRFTFHSSSQIIKVNNNNNNSKRQVFVVSKDKDISWSWLPPDDQYPPDKFGGWSLFQPQFNNPKDKKGTPIIVIWGIGSTLAALIGAIVCFSLSPKGFKFQLNSPLNALHGVLNLEEKNPSRGTTSESNVNDNVMAEEAWKSTSDGKRQSLGSMDMVGRVRVSVAVDSTQQEALSVLKKLKIIEDDVKADELCTRREYARWLVHINSLLERNPKYRIVPSILLSGSIISAFDDVAIGDPDFKHIQALAEAGIIPSKLSGSNMLEGQGNVRFFPESFVSRQDLVNWKAQVEYKVKPGIIEQISTTKVDYIDMKGISPDASPELFMDMLAGNKSIIRKVFGQVKRFQPNKPSTKAQAAVILTSGRMMEAIYSELARLKAEEIFRQAVMEEIRTYLLEKGEIQKLWDEKLDEEKPHRLKAEELYREAVSDLEQENVIQEKVFAVHLKEKAAMNCQRQLLLNLKDEVDDMLKKLESERAMFVDDKYKTECTLNDLESKREGLLDKKSVLEAEKEAMRILRCWIEEDARKSQARSKVLEEVGRRWKWDNPE